MFSSALMVCVCAGMFSSSGGNAFAGIAEKNKEKLKSKAATDKVFEFLIFSMNMFVPPENNFYFPYEIKT